ncbi:hypothetical protein HELRODRAFT_152280, partial [Helobdella robusta]|uniref:Kinesin motor domain-containing protein n=1 Tax=Helobdella robusta TaxID=6412 RepID=T1EKQ4_HELRO
SSSLSLGIIPTAISWLYQLISERSTQTGMGYCVKISAVQVFGRQEVVTDLLSGLVGGQFDDSIKTLKVTYDPLRGPFMEQPIELRALSIEQAAYYLDTAIKSKTTSEIKEDWRNSHFIFTLHLYHYK